MRSYRTLENFERQNNLSNNNWNYMNTYPTNSRMENTGNFKSTYDSTNYKGNTLSNKFKTFGKGMKIKKNKNKKAKENKETVRKSMKLDYFE